MIGVEFCAFFATADELPRLLADLQAAKWKPRAKTKQPDGRFRVPATRETFLIEKDRITRWIMQNIY